MHSLTERPTKCPIRGVWSYARDDDRRGKVSKLQEEFTQTPSETLGERVTMYQDTESAHWGDEWKKSIDLAVESADFLVAVATPYYFNRVHCRYELEQALKKGKLICPIYYRDSVLLEDERLRGRQKKSAEESEAAAARVAEEAAQRQHRDFRKLRNKPLKHEQVQDFIDEAAKDLSGRLRARNAQTGHGDREKHQ